MSMMMTDAIVSRLGRPVSVHDCRLAAVLTVPDAVKWMVERLHADHSAICIYVICNVIVIFYFIVLSFVFFFKFLL